MSEQVYSEIAAGEGQSLNQLAKLFPSTRKGKPVTLGCVLRWVLTGVRLPDGSVVRLEAARCSGRWLSTRAAIQRFLASQTPGLDRDPAFPRTRSERQRASELAAKQLEKIGI